MANAVVAYLKKSINPGGTPKRMKEWLGAMLLIQVAAMVLPGKSIESITAADMVIMSATVFTVSLLWGYRKPNAQVRLCWVFFYIGMAVHVAGAVFYDTNRSDFVMVTSWGIAMFINERRFYINFAQFMYAVLCVTLIITIITLLTIDSPLQHAPNNVPLAAAGMLTVACNIYLLITDFRYGKHRMDYFERHFDKISELSTSLSNILMVAKPIEEAMWDVTRTCIPLLGLEDFIIYLYDKDKNRLVQVAAHGRKGARQVVDNPMEVEPGQGIVGKVFTSKKPILIEDTSQYPDYIVDDAVRFSELAVPILIGEDVFGVIDSEHSQRGFYKETHLQLFHIIAAFCSIKAARYEVQMQILEAETNKLEMAKIRELEQLKNKFITNISHDLKTPLSLILGPANQVFKTTKDDFTRQQAKYIIKNTDHLMAMVEQLLQLNRIEQGMETLHPELVDLDRILTDIHLQYTPLAEETGVRFTLDIESGLLLKTDNFKLSQCVHNLVQNAFKYAKGEVALAAKRGADNMIHISVADDGTGIAEEEHGRIFERFYKLDVNNHKGTGIGLSLVKEYITQMKGSVKVESAPGRGAKFALTLPGHTGATAQPGAPIYDPAATDDKKPLVVIAEDHAELNAFIAQSLQINDFRCIQAYNGSEALKLVEEYLPDLVITDLMMPQMPGEELVASIKNSDTLEHIPIIVLTARNQVDDRIDLYHAGADNYIPKPFKMDELLAVVENVLKQRKKLRDKFYRNYMPGGAVAIDETDSADNGSMLEDNPLIKQCMDYVLANIDEPGLNVNSLGASMGMGRNRLQKEIKNATGMTPVEFIRSIRLHEAYRLMQSNRQYNISEVAYKAGFSNLSYFSRSFKAQFGYAPSEMTAAEVNQR